MRKTSNTVDYFSHDCRPKNSLRIIDSLYGNDGVALWWRLLENLGDTENHFLDFNDEIRWLKFCGDCHLAPERAEEIVNMLSRVGCIDSKLWQERHIWSENFVTRLAEVYKKRGRQKPEKPFLDRKPHLTTPEKPKLAPAIPQRKVKESKVKESKEEKGITAPPLDLPGLWLELTSGILPGIVSINATRKNKILSRLKETPDNYENKNYWTEVIKKITESSFCTGNNNRGWKASFDWLLQPETHLKVMEGKYDNHKGQNLNSTQKNILALEAKERSKRNGDGA